MIPDFKTFIKESIWSDIQDRSSGDTVRKEDDVNLLDRDEFYDYLKNKYNKISHLIYEDPSEIHITLGWSYFPRRDYKIDIHWVEKNKIKNLYLNFGPCELDTLCNKKFKTGTANDDISNEEILNIIDFCLDYISSHKECESPMNESIWSDIQDRSSGDTVRKEDDINHLDIDEFIEYLKKSYDVCIYDPYDFNEIHEMYSNEHKSIIYIPIEKNDENETPNMGDRILTITVDLEHSGEGSITPNMYVFILYSREIQKTFGDKYIINTSKRTLTPKDKIINNSVIVDVIDKLLGMVESPILKKN